MREWRKQPDQLDEKPRKMQPDQLDEKPRKTQKPYKSNHKIYGTGLMEKYYENQNTMNINQKG